MISVSNSHGYHTIFVNGVPINIKVAGEHSNPSDKILYWWAATTSAVALGNYIISSSSSFPGKTVLELGCGPAIPGIIAAKCGAKVILSDYSEEALELAKVNAELNSVSERCTTLKLDWEKPTPNITADVIIGSEIIYDYSAHSALIGVLEKYLNESGTLLLADRQRLSVTRFIGRLIRRGFSSQKNVITPKYDGFPEQEISLYTLQRDSADIFHKPVWVCKT